MSALRDVTDVERSWETGGPKTERAHELQRIRLSCGHVAERRSPPGAMIDPVAWRCLDCPNEVVPIAHCPYCSFPACGHEACAPRSYVPGEVCQCCGRRVGVV